MDLADAVRRRREPPRTALRGLGDAWRTAESALNAVVGANPRRADALVAAFERLARRSGEDEAIGRALRLRGSALSHQARHTESLAPYRAAARRLSGAARDGARLGLALSLTRLGRMPDAVRVCREVRRAARTRGDAVLAAAATINEATALHEGGDPLAALPRYREARAAFLAAGQARHAAYAANGLANALVRLDRFDEAASHFAEASAELSALGLAREAAVVRYNRGELLAATDRLGEADAELEAAERALRAAGDLPNAALARLDRGDALLRAHLVPEARALLTTARRAMGVAAPPVERARAAFLEARAEIESGDAAGALRVLEVPLALRTPALDAERLELRGRAAAHARRFAEARPLLERAARGYGRERPAARAGALAAAAWCAIESGDLSDALRLARTASTAAARLPVPGLRFAADAALFGALERTARDAPPRSRAKARRAASDALDRAFAHLEELRAGLGPDAMRTALLRGSEAWLARAVRHVLDADGAEAALRVAERWRARALVDLLSSGAGPADPDERVASLRARLAVLERRFGGGTLPSLLRSAAAPPLRCVAREIAATERALRTEISRSTVARAVAPPNVTERLRSLRPGSVLVSLFADDDGGVAFCADASGVRAVRGLGSAPEIAALAEELHFRVGKFTLGPAYAARHAGRLAAETDAILARLAELTLAPIADLVRGAERVVVVPQGPWLRVPIAALPFDGAPLLASRAVTSTPAVAALGAAPPAATGAPLVLAVADAQAPRIADEGRRVAATLRGARLLEDDAATSDVLAAGPPPSVLHVAAHGRFRADEPSLSGVRLADGWLRACELPRMPLRGTTVVLSGCDTGAARADAGDEVLGLVRGFLAAGARELVVSLWRVDDAATAELMADLHAARDAGHATPEALRRVQASRAAAGAHPWLWAGFTAWSREG